MDQLTSGGWSLGEKSFQFEFRSSNDRLGVDGTVQIIEGASCRRAKLNLVKHDDEWLSGHWEESSLSPCAAKAAQVSRIDSTLVEEINRIDSRFNVDWPLPLTDLKPDEFELAPMIYGSGRLEIVGSDRQGIRPILKIGQLELAGVMVARRIVDGPAYRVFEKIEGTIVIRRMVLSESDAALAKKSGLINCIRMALDDLRIKRDHQEKRESTHSAEDSRRETKQIAIDVMRDQVDAYRLNPEVATCLN